jgi:hypothetical protein
MDINITATSSLGQYQTISVDSRRNSSQAADTDAAQPTDKAEISREGMDAYKEYQKSKTESPEYKYTINKLTARQNEVIAHEQAHMTAGGSAVGTATYSYTLGPDGNRYITGGEVPISIPETGYKEQMLNELEQVKKRPSPPPNPPARTAASPPPPPPKKSPSAPNSPPKKPSKPA